MRELRDRDWGVGAGRDVDTQEVRSLCRGVTFCLESKPVLWNADVGLFMPMETTPWSPGRRPRGELHLYQERSQLRSSLVV